MGGDFIIKISMGFLQLNKIILTIGLVFSINGLHVVLGNSTILYNEDCSIGCLKCNLYGCIKCRVYLNPVTRDCAEKCKLGYTAQWSTNLELMGKTCQRTRFYSSILAITVGSACGIILCIILIFLMIVFMKRKTNTTKPYRNTLIHDNNERIEFLRQLDSLRLHADHFLAMVNDTRRQIQKLHSAGDVAGANAYHAIVCDLAKILILLNKPNEMIHQPPNDWNRLVSWADFLLEHHKPDMAQFVDFFQTPKLASQDPRLSFCQHSTFKSNITRTTAATASDSSNEQHNNPFGSLISLHEFDQSSRSNTNPFGSSKNLRYLYEPSDMNGSSLWLEDEFFKLGFRPQDEITTEL